MDAASSLTFAATLIANRLTAPEIVRLLDQLPQPDRGQVEAGLQAIAARMPDVIRYGQAIAAGQALPAIPLTEPRHVLYQRLREELAMVEDALRAGRGTDPDTLMPLVDWKATLTKRKQSLEALAAVG